MRGIYADHHLSLGTHLPSQYLVIMAGVGLLFTCLICPTPTPAPPTPAPTLAPGPATLRLSLGGEPSLDPALVMDTASVKCNDALFLGLTDFDDETLEAIPELAEKWEVSSDGLKWKFYLRQDVYWVKYDPTSGKAEKMRPVTAHDVEYGVKRTLNPTTASDYAYVLYIIRGAKPANTREGSLDDVAVKALDDYTVEFELVTPAAYFPGIAGMWMSRPVPKEIIEEHGDNWTEPENIWTNGPYLLDTWQHHNKMVFVRNPAYYLAEEVTIETVEALLFGNWDVTIAKYKRGDLDHVEVPRSKWSEVMSDPMLSQELTIAPGFCTYAYGFNTTKPPVDNPLVRQALSYAVDRQKLIDTVLKGGQIPAWSFACPGIFGSPAEDPGFPGVVFDPAKARDLLAQAGYPNGEGWPGDVVLMFNTSADHQKIAEFIQSQWKEHLGIEVELAYQDWSVYLKTVSEDAPQIFRLGWCATYPDENNWVLDVFHSTKGVNPIKWSNAEFDQLVEQAAFETDPAKRKDLYFEAEKILCVDRAGIIPIYYDTRAYLTKPYVERTYTPLGKEHYDRWKVKAHPIMPSLEPPTTPPTPTP